MKSILKLFVNSMFAILLPFSISQAQDNNSKTPLQRGKNALEFQISDNFNLDSFSGTTFSYKRQLSDARAKRIGLSLSNSYAQINHSDNINNRDGSSLNLEIGIDYTWMNYTNPESDIKFFYGYGPGINLGFRKSEQEQTGLKNTDQDISYGIAGIGYAGVEWFFQSSMSLHAEYRASIRFNQLREKNTAESSGNDEQINKTNSTSIILGGDGVRFGLSVYF